MNSPPARSRSPPIGAGTTNWNVDPLTEIPVFTVKVVLPSSEVNDAPTPGPVSKVSLAGTALTMTVSPGWADDANHVVLDLRVDHQKESLRLRAAYQDQSIVVSHVLNGDGERICKRCCRLGELNAVLGCVARRPCVDPK